MPAADQKKPGPLTIKEQGSFFVGGENKTITQPGFGPNPATSGDITVNQMYVQYQIPMKGDQHVPVVMVHGCCLSSKTWETTPDGRMGWSEYFVRKDRPVYLADQVVARAFGIRSDGVHRRATAGKRRRRQDAEHPDGDASDRRGRCSASARSSARRFPTSSSRSQAVDELYKQMIPDLNATLPAIRIRRGRRWPRSACS